MRPFRFGFQLTGEHEADPVRAARRAEAVGFDVALVADHVGPRASPLPTLTAIAQATERIRVGTFVLNNDMRNPVQLAWDAATIDRLSGGRFELGLGAGHTPQEYAGTGIAMDPPLVRKRRLGEAVEIIRRLLDGGTVDWDGEHYRLEGAGIEPAAQTRLPLLVGGNGETLLTHAGAHADSVGLQGLARTLEDGHRHAVDFAAARVDRQVATVARAAAAAGRTELPELNALVQVVALTDDRAAGLNVLVDRVEGLTVADAAETPYLLVGSVDEIVAHIRHCRERWGISYFAVRELDGFAPVIERLRGE